MIENREKSNCWAIIQAFHQDSDVPEKLIDNDIITLGFDENVDLRDAIDNNLDVEKYIDDKCKYSSHIKKFTEIKLEDYFIYKAYRREENTIKFTEYLGKVTKDFEIGYKLDSKLGHTLPIKWINKRSIKLNQSIYTWSLNKIDNSDIKKHLEYVNLEQDEELIKELESSTSNKIYLNNYLYKDIHKYKDNNEIIVSPNSIKIVNTLKSIKSGDYIIFINKENILNEKNSLYTQMTGVCKVKSDFKKEYRISEKLDYKLDVEWVRNPQLSDENFASRIGFYNVENESYMNRNIFKKPLNSILYGPPGTGKTYNTSNEAIKMFDYLQYKDKFINKEMNKENIRKFIKETSNEGFFKFCTFHQSYGYEEFIEGLKSDGSGNFILEDGVLKEIAIEAIYEGLKLEKKIDLEINKDDLTPLQIKEYKKKLVQENIHNSDSFDFSKANNYILVIDEINRGNISKIFGELITLLEEDKRLTEENQIIVSLPYSKEAFCLPPNLYILGTMNTSDKSIALMDVALRRRFHFKEMMPDSSLLSTVDNIDLKTMLETINNRIEFLYDRDYMIGHAYLMNIENIDDISDVFKNKIIPLLQEYFYDDWEKIGLILGGIGNGKSDNYIVYKQEIKASDLFKNSSIANKYGSKTKYYIKRDIGAKELKNIYE